MFIDGRKNTTNLWSPIGSEVAGYVLRIRNPSTSGGGEHKFTESYAKEKEMIGNKRFIFLAEKFYQQYPAEQYPELEQKRDRPYIQIWVTIDGVNFAIPLRSNIHHPFVFWTDEEQHCGVDFSKAVVLPDESYINESITPHLRDNEFAALYNKDYIIERQMRRYIQKYKRAKANLQKPFNRKLVNFSTLQYFENEIVNIN